MGMVALLTGVYHVSRRRAAKLLSDLVGVAISSGAVSAVEARVSDAVEPAVAEAWQRVAGAPVKHTDGTTWLKAGPVLALWTIASAAATVFKISTDVSWAPRTHWLSTLKVSGIGWSNDCPDHTPRP
jgi:transposase